MIVNFPDSYPDELFYSICARFAERMQYPSGRSVIRELFGSANAIACVSLPSHLDHFIAQMPLHYGYSADNIIDNYTLLPLFAAFLPPERRDRLRQDMRSDKGPALHMRAGTMASRVSFPLWLHVCPHCIEEDRQKFGECYWHRVHQAPGVEVCPTHRCWLRNSAARAREMQTRYEFVSAEKALQLELLEESNQDTSNFEILLALALDIKWLLDTVPSSQSLSSLSERYQSTLYSLGLSTYRGRIDREGLLSRFKEMYSPNLLNLLHCELDEHIEDSWLMRLVRKPNNAQHPLHHILFIHNLGFNTKQFFNLPARAGPFGYGPWPCLNPACRYYHQLQVHECSITYSPYLKGMPTGSFSCSCGFVYSRTGPDTSTRDQFKISRIQHFGAIWEARLEILWCDETYSIREIARQLSVDSLTVKRHAARLGLIFPRPVGRGGQLKNIQELRNSKGRVVEPALLEQYRRQWIETLQTYSEVGLSIVRGKCPGVYTWLYRNDREWLQAHFPVSTKGASRSQSSSIVDWKTRDVNLAQMVEISAKHLKCLEGRPVKVTVSAIGKDIGQLSLLQQHLSKLPMTAQQLERHIETREEFAIRRIRWVAKQYQEEIFFPKRWQFIKRAGLERVANSPQVQEALENEIKVMFLR